MTDLSKFSDSDLEALASGDIKKLSDQGLGLLHSHAVDEETQKHEQRMGAAKTTLENFGNSASLGYLPHLQAAAEPLTAKLGDMITGKNVSADLPSYVNRRDENIARQGQQSKDHPLAALAGSIGGSLATAAPMSALAPIRAASLAGRAAQAAQVGAAVGAASNPGDIEGQVDPTQLKARGTNAVLGGAMSVPLQMGGEAVGKLGGYLGDKLGSFAEQKAFKALGPFKREVKQNQENINSIGRTVLDKGVVRAMPAGAEGLAQRAEAANELAGKRVGDVVEKLANQENAPSLSRSEVSKNIRSALIQEPGLPGSAVNNKRVDRLVSEFEDYGKGMGVDPSDEVSLKKAREFKKMVGDRINWNRPRDADIPPHEEVLRALYGELKQGEEGIAESLAKSGQIDNPGEFLQAKKDYGNLSKAQGIAENRSASDKANRFLGLTDTIAGGAGASIGATLGGYMGGHEGAVKGAEVGGFVGGIGNKLGRTYGNQVLASGANAMSNLLKKSPQLQAFIQQNPAALPMLEQKLFRQTAQPQEPQAQAQLNPQIMDQIKKNPQMIESLKNPQLKDQMSQWLKNQTDKKEGETEPQKKYESPESARQQFLDAN